MSSNIIIKNSSDTTLYTFGAGFSLVGYPLTKRVTEEGRAHQHGSVITSDKKVSSRLVTIEGVLHQTEAGVEIQSSSAFEAEWDELLEAVDKETLHIYGYKASRYIICDCLEYANHEWAASNRAGRIELGFRATNPFWHSTSQDDSTQDVTATGQTKVYANSGKASVYPVITWTAKGAQTVVKIKNQTDGNKEFTYTGSLGIDDVLEVDCADGTVKVNGTSQIGNFSGPFWKLLSGNNTIEFTITGVVNTSTCQVVSRPRWL